MRLFWALVWNRSYVAGLYWWKRYEKTNKQIEKKGKTKEGNKQTNEHTNYKNSEFGIIRMAMLCSLTYEKSPFIAFYEFS